MSIAFDTTLPPRAPRRATSAPTTVSLLSRIEKPPLAQRLTADDSKIPSAPCVSRIPAYLCIPVQMLISYHSSISIPLHAAYRTLTLTGARLLEAPSGMPVAMRVEAQALPVPPRHRRSRKRPRISTRSWMRTWERETRRWLLPLPLRNPAPQLPLPMMSTWPRSSLS